MGGNRIGTGKQEKRVGRRENEPEEREVDSRAVQNGQESRIRQNLLQVRQLTLIRIQISQQDMVEDEILHHYPLWSIRKKRENEDCVMKRCQ